MSIELSQTSGFMHPEVFSEFKLPVSDPEVFPMKSAINLRREINRTADVLGMHPFAVVKELRMGEAENALKAFHVQERYGERHAYVGDIHGLKDPEFAKLHQALLNSGYDSIHFVGDIGGSEKLARLQRLFYQGGPASTDNLFYNRAKDLIKESADDVRLFSELQEGYKNIFAFEKELESHGRLSEVESRALAQHLPPDRILEGIKRLISYKHYGHYVSNLSEHAIIALALDVESYYERFMHLVADLRLNTKAKVDVLQGNWDARLPFDFERGTPDPVPLPIDRRRFKDREFFEKYGIPYFTNVGSVETEKAMHLLVPFDAVAKGIDEEGGLLTSEKVTHLKNQIQKAKKAGKTVIMVAHAVPSWERHHKPATGEGQVTERNLLILIGHLKPHEIVYGHEHFFRRDADGGLLSLDSKYQIILDEMNNAASVKEQDIPIEDLSAQANNQAVIATHLPIPNEPFNGIATKELMRRVRDQRPRGTGGKNSPVRVGHEDVRIREVPTDLPTEKILFPNAV